MNKKYRHQRAIDILDNELIKLGGVVFARFGAHQDPETESHVKAREFLGRVFSGELADSEKDFLLPYLEPFYELNKTIKFLKGQGFEEDEKVN